MNTVFSQLTWTQFAIAAVILLSAYYLTFFIVPGLIHLRVTLPGHSTTEKAVGLLSNLSAGAEVPKGKEVIPDLIGKTRLPEGVAIINSEDLQFVVRAAASSNAITDDESDAVPPGLKEDLQLIFAQLSAQDGSKKDFFQRVGELREFYHGLASHPAIASITSWLRQTAPFQLTQEEAESLWT